MVDQPSDAVTTFEGLFLLLLPPEASAAARAVGCVPLHAPLPWTVGYGSAHRETLQPWMLPEGEDHAIEDALALVRRLLDEGPAFGAVLMLDPYTTEVSPTAEDDGLAQGLDACHVGLACVDPLERPPWTLQGPWHGALRHADPLERPDSTMWVLLALD